MDYAEMGKKGGSIGGRARTPAKVKAVRENGKLGGRPRLPASQLSEAARIKRAQRKSKKEKKEVDKPKA